ncbi:hypothetical protein BOX15_Mlig020072g2 [Macrostomum lignano]|uniref:Mediator of RNA polymerase II transcription subunit 8 n=1 Tax=Macrostomum lignano TaxID=282301 RepID=A0A267FCB4_9PLAT|nr:hypothetical protein BOX15_Mlig020072g2 [Macrostomum lignano]
MADPFQHQQLAGREGGGGNRGSDDCLDELIDRLRGIRRTLCSLIAKVDEKRPATWPEILNCLAECVSQLSALHRTLRNEKQLRLNDFALLPIGLSPQLDQHLLNHTEGRLGLLNHDSVPHYLRTKLDLSVEHRRNEFQKSSTNIEAQPRTSEQMRKAAETALNSLKQARPDFENEQSERNQTMRSNEQDTAKLLLAINFGIGLN